MIYTNNFINKYLSVFTIICLVFFISNKSYSSSKSSTVSLEPSDIIEYEEAPPIVKKIIKESMKLSSLGLTYKFGSNSIKNNGMDCSGTIQFLLNSCGIYNVPRTSFLMYNWVKDTPGFVNSRGIYRINDPMFNNLRPGYLLFWEGTYKTNRNPPISHVMIFLGHLKKDGKGVMFGSSDGRRFRGKKITGVSLHDWKVPKKGKKSKFVAYSPIPITNNSEKIISFHKKTKKQYLDFLKVHTVIKKFDNLFNKSR